MRTRLIAHHGRSLRSVVQALETRTMLSYDILGVQPAALDQPRADIIVRLTPTGSPLLETDPFFGATTYNIPVYYDTGASGTLLSTTTADALGLTHATSGGQTIIYSDVGVGGSDNFYVSEPMYTSLGVNGGMLDGIQFDPISGEFTIVDPSVDSYTQTFGPIRIEIGAIPADAPPTSGDIYDTQQILSELEPLDVFGMPTILGKVMVMDPKPTNAMVDGFGSTSADPSAVLGGSMRTYVYNPGTPFDAANADTDPGIPSTNRHIRLSMASFDRFTTVTPAGAVGPTLAPNPFIGPNPVFKATAGAAPDKTPPVSMKMGSLSATGSFLLDTGAAASMISQATARKLGVRYRAGTFHTDNPILEDTNGNPIPNQFTLAIGGVGGTFTAAGFFLDEMTLPTVENDPIRYLGAPVLVSDVTVQDPTNGQTLTLDGVFGMNNLVASAMIGSTADVFGFPEIGALNKTPFDWVVFDPQSKLLGVNIPGQPTATLAPVGAVSTSGTAAVTLAVSYSSDNAISAASIDNADLLITGPGGIAVSATANTSSIVDGTAISVNYTVTPPGGAWSKAPAGTYTVSIRAGQVSDASSQSVPAVQLGTFVVTDNTPPAAILLAPASPVTGNADYTFKVTYSDNTAINLATLNSNDILVTGPKSYSQVATYVGRTVVSAKVVTVTYKIAAPAPTKKWSAAATGTYTITLRPSQVSDTVGNYALTRKLGTFGYTVKAGPKIAAAVFSATQIVATPPRKSALDDLLD